MISGLRNACAKPCAIPGMRAKVLIPSSRSAIPGLRKFLLWTEHNYIYGHQFEKFKMGINVTENQPIFLYLIKNKTSNTDKMLFNILRCIMVLQVLCKDALFT